MKTVKINKFEPLKRTKIIATIGPQIDTVEKLSVIAKTNNLSAIRINFSHGNNEYYQKCLSLMSEINHKQNFKISVLGDSKGPEIRIGKFKKEKSTINQNETIKVYFKKDKFKHYFCLENEITLSLDPSSEIKIGNSVLIDDGKLQLEVKEKTSDFLICQAKNTHQLVANKRVNIVGTKLKLPFLSEKDKSDFLFVCQNKQAFDYLALSFVSDKQDVEVVRKFFQQHGNDKTKIISKIETQNAIDNIDEIIEASDGIMFARGDLGIEIPYYELPYWQKIITRKCLQKQKIIIIATQMLDTMINNPFPTRAEITDVYNATEQGVDALMLSAETAIGKYPQTTIEVMTKIIRFAEKNFFSKTYYLKKYLARLFEKISSTKRSIIAHFLTFLVKDGKFPLTIVLSKTGTLLKKISVLRPNTTVIGIVKQKELLTKFGLNHGVYVLLEEESKKHEEIVSKIKNLFNLPSHNKILLVYHDSFHVF